MLQSFEPANPRLLEQQSRKAAIFDPPHCRIHLFLPILVLFAFVLLNASPSAAQDPFVGKIIAIDSGTAAQAVNIVRLGKNGYAKAKTGDALFVGDTIRTGKGVKARIELADKSTINIGAESILQMKGHLFAPAEAKRNYVFKALKGIIRFIIAPTLKSNNGGPGVPWKDSNVTVETTTAVAGVRGTDFVVINITDGPVPVVVIAVLDGLVRVRSLSLSNRDAVMLTTNQVTRVQHGAGPGAVEPLSDSRKNELVQLTTPSVSDQPKNGQTGKKEERQKKYSSSDAARDLAAGATVAEVLDRSALAGMSVDDMIAAILEAGVDPYVIVYTAITEGFPVRPVVAAAVRNGAPLNVVVSASVMAGGEMNAVISGAADAGAPPDAIASAAADVDSSGGSIYTYTLPVTNAPGISSTALYSGMIFAPSGAPASASPYCPNRRCR